MRIISVAIAGLGAMFLFIAVILFVVEASFLSRAELTTGTVSQLRRTRSSEGDGYTFCPVFTFSTRGGQQVSYEADVCASPAAYKVGDREELYYDPKDPQSVQMNNFWSKYVGVFAMAVIGLPFLLLGAASFLPSKRNPAKRTPNSLSGWRA